MKSLVTLTSALLLTTVFPAGALAPMIDCAADPGNIRCVTRDLGDSAGTIGSGPAIYQGGTDVLRGGFVTPDGRTLIVAVETLRNDDQFGAVMAIDLNTGNRTLISGYLNSIQRAGKGVKAQGDRGDTLDLYTLGNVTDVKPLPDGSLVAYAGQAIRIDPATGDRTLLWTPVTAGDTRVRDTVEVKYRASNTSTASGGGSSSAPGGTISTPVGTVNVGGFLGGLFGGQKPAAPAQPAPASAAGPGNGYFCRQTDEKAPLPALPSHYMHVDAQGNIYLMGSNSPIGAGFALFKLDAKNDYRCTAISRFNADGDDVLGGGIPWTNSSMGSGPQFGNFALNGATLYASGGPNPNYMVVSVDLRTGERRLVSGQTHEGGAQIFKKGQGSGHIGSMLTFSGGKLYTTQEQVKAEAFTLVQIDPASGDRTILLPAKNTPLARGFASNVTLYAVPNSDQLLVWFNGALHVLDPKTGQNFILSR